MKSKKNRLKINKKEVILKKQANNGFCFQGAHIATSAAAGSKPVRTSTTVQSLLPYSERAIFRYF
jgi:hypothetical protein